MNYKGSPKNWWHLRFFFDFPKSKCGGKCYPINKKRKALRTNVQTGWPRHRENREFGC